MSKYCIQLTFVPAKSLVNISVGFRYFILNFNSVCLFLLLLIFPLQQVVWFTRLFQGNRIYKYALAAIFTVLSAGIRPTAYLVVEVWTKRHFLICVLWLHNLGEILLNKRKIIYRFMFLMIKLIFRLCCKKYKLSYDNKINFCNFYIYFSKWCSINIIDD